MMNEYMYKLALRHLDMWYSFIDNTYPEFNRANYGDLVELNNRLAEGERTIELYEAIMSWSP